MPPLLLQKLPELLDSRIGQWLSRSKDKLPTRIIASTTSNLHEMVQMGRFPKTLLAELDFLSLVLPSLRNRIDDISSILGYLLEKNGFLPEEKCSSELIGACKVYPWPENPLELERTVVRLATMTGRTPISSADIEKYAPWLCTPPNTQHLAHSPASQVRDGSLPTAPSYSAPSTPQWVRAVVDKDFSELRILHPNLQRALAYLSENFAETISLGELAKHSGVSPSHLAYLFKSALGIPFKPFLGRVRIEKAKQRLVDWAPVRITEVAFDVGFMDLSHFEKLFKRVVGVNAREYRRRNLAPREVGS